jgi:DNA gyrase subunit B
LADLTRLKGSERIRKRVSVMMGSDDIKGCQHTLFEITSNSIDRYRKGYGNYIKIIKHKDLNYSVLDFADGLPMEWNEKENAYNWDLALKVLYASDNYDADSTSIGLNGLGLTSSQYASDYMNVISYRDGKKYTTKFKKGRPVDKNTEEFICDDDDNLFSKEQGERVLKTESNIDNEQGTKIYYKPDLEVFTNINIPIDWINDKLKKQTVVNKGLKIDVYDESADIIYTHFYENGIVDYLQEITTDENITDIITFSDSGIGKDRSDKPEYKFSYEIAFVFNNTVNTLQYFHNSSELLQGGSTAEAIESAFTNAIHEYIKNNNLYNKNESKIKFTDIQDSFSCMISSFSTMTSYANQTKLSINNKFIKDFTTSSLKDKLIVYFTENKLVADKIIGQCLINKRANEKAEQSKLDIKKKLQGETKSSFSKIPGVKHCDFKKSKVEERIFIVDEGISANSTIENSIDPRIMGCCGLRGRFINSYKAKVSDVLDNEPALRIINALGCGIEIPYEERKKYKDIQTFNIDNLNYGSLGILCDRDAFGRAINLSILTFMYKFMPTLLKQNRVYLITSPRYEFILTKTEESLFAYNDIEKENLIQELNSKNIKYTIGIKKGLGEFNKEDFWLYVLSDEARKKTFIPVEYDQLNEALINKHFEMFMDTDTLPRKEFIRENITKIDLNNIE